jgi:hypothetical protein
MEARFRAQFRPVHRVAPWFLVSLLLVGVAVGAVFGAAQGSPTPPPSQWVADALTATQEAGSAQFSYTHVSLSPNPDLRGRLSGHGEVDFITDHVRVSEVDRDISFTSTGNQPLHPVSSTTNMDAIVVNGTVYEANPIPGLPFAGKYIKLPFPALPRSQRGLSLALNASVALSTLRGPNAVESVTVLGPAEVAGVQTTQYEVTYAPLRVCAPHQAPQVLHQRPSRVWLDGAGRLVRVRSTLYYSGRLPLGATVPAAFDDIPSGPVTTVATLTFTKFGAPVHVVAPPKSAVLSNTAISKGISTFQSDSCHS